MDRNRPNPAANPPGPVGRPPESWWIWLSVRTWYASPAISGSWITAVEARFRRGRPLGRPQPPHCNALEAPAAAPVPRLPAQGLDLPGLSRGQALDTEGPAAANGPGQAMQAWGEPSPPRSVRSESDPSQRPVTPVPERCALARGILPRMDGRLNRPPAPVNRACNWDCPQPSRDLKAWMATPDPARGQNRGWPPVVELGRG